MLRPRTRRPNDAPVSLGLGYAARRMSKKARAKPVLSDETRVTAGHSHHRAPTWSPDGRMLAFSTGGLQDGSWVVTDRRGRVARCLEGPAAGTASFGPDGRLAFQRVFGGTSEIWLTPGGDAPPVRLLGGDGCLYRDPAFSPDGKTLACAIAEEPDARSHLMLVNLESGQRTHLHLMPQRANGHPAWDPSGESILFDSVRDDDTGLFIVHLANEHVDRLTPEGETARRPAVIEAGWFIHERTTDDGRSELVLRRSGDDRALAVDGDDDEFLRSDPVCHVGRGGKIRVAYAAQKLRSDGEPPRFDIYLAQLTGVAR